MRISGVIYPPSEKFPAFISIIPNTDELKISDVSTRRTYLTSIKVSGYFMSYKEHNNGIEFKFLENGSNIAQSLQDKRPQGSNYFYYIPYSKALRFSQSYNTITKSFYFAYNNQTSTGSLSCKDCAIATLYYIPKTISIMFNYTSLRPSLQNYIILCSIIDVCNIRGIIFSIWSHIILADKNGYEMVNEFDTFNSLWNLEKLLLM